MSKVGTNVDETGDQLLTLIGDFKSDLCKD